MIKIAFEAHIGKVHATTWERCPIETIAHVASMKAQRVATICSDKHPIDYPIKLKTARYIKSEVKDIIAYYGKLYQRLGLTDL